MLAAIDDAAHALESLSPRRVLVEAPTRVSIDAGLEAAIRGWAYTTRGLGRRWRAWMGRDCGL